MQLLLKTMNSTESSTKMQLINLLARLNEADFQLIREIIFRLAGDRVSAPPKAIAQETLH